MVPVDGRVDVFEPGESQNHVFISQGDNVEGDFLGDALDVEEEGGSEANHSFAVDGVIGVSRIDWFL